MPDEKGAEINVALISTADTASTEYHLISIPQINPCPALNLKHTMSVTLPPPTHRKRALPQGELEAASTLKLGADQNTHTLSLSEARLVIHKVLENKRRGGNKYEEPE